MDEGKLNLYLRNLQRAFVDGDWTTLAKSFQIPLVIYSEAGVALFRNKDHLMRVLQQYRTALGTTDVASTTLDIEHRDTPLNQRFRATVRIVDFGDDGTELRRSVIRYFLLETGDSYIIEMVEYIESSLPLSEVERIVH